MLGKQDLLVVLLLLVVVLLQLVMVLQLPQLVLRLRLCLCLRLSLGLRLCLRLHLRLLGVRQLRARGSGTPCVSIRGVAPSHAAVRRRCWVQVG
mgnify:CR=1 FL=1